MKIQTWVTTKRGNQFQVLLPAKRIVCPCCDGTGTELCEGLRGVAFSEEDMLEAGDEFREGYMRGDYDVHCAKCDGNNVVTVVDEAALTTKMRDRYFRAVNDHEAHLAEIAMERRRFA